MSLQDYQKSKEISIENYSFTSLIMAAMRKADLNNLSRLAFSFPAILDELKARYASPEGKLENE